MYLKLNNIGYNLSITNYLKNHFNYPKKKTLKNTFFNSDISDIYFFNIFSNISFSEMSP